jgi:hypothetical protein
MFFIFILIFFLACDGGKGKEGEKTAEGAPIEEAGKAAGKIPEGKQLDAVCMFEGLWLRNMPTNPNESGFKWIAGLMLGDVVTYLGETAKQDGKQDGLDLIKVKDLNGNVGWVPYVNVILDATPGVIKTTSKKFASAQLTSDTGKKAEPMTVVGVIKGSNKDKFVQVAIYSTQPFWVLEEDISTQDYDVALAKLFKNAKWQYENKKITLEELIKKLDEMRTDKLYANSIFLSAVDEEYQKLAGGASAGGGEYMGDEEEAAEEDAATDDPGM